MMDQDFKKIVTFGIIGVLLLLTFLVLRPILLSIIIGIILGMVFAPVFTFTSKYIKNKAVNATIICASLILVILVLLLTLTPMIIQQSFQVYLKAQQINFKDIIEAVFPSLSISADFSAELGSVVNKFVSNSINSVINSFSDIVLNLPYFLLQLVIVFSTFFFILTDKEELIAYVKSLMPFSKEVENKLFKSSTDITLSVIYGQFVIGTLQGLITGLGFFIFGVKNSLFLTLVAVLAGILPIIGTTLVWIPVIVFMFLAGNNFQAFGIALFGIVGSLFESIAKPILVSKRAQVHPLLVLIGMIGGLFLFGVLGFILGPLIIAYVIIILEIYRGKQIKGIFITNPI